MNYILVRRHHTLEGHWIVVSRHETALAAYKANQKLQPPPPSYVPTRFVVSEGKTPKKGQVIDRKWMELYNAEFADISEDGKVVATHKPF